MRKSIIVLLALLVPIIFRGQQGSTIRADKDSVAEKEIQQLEFFLADLLEKGDLDTYAGYLTDDYVRIAANGTVSTKQEILEGLKKSKAQVKMMPHDLHVRVYGNTAILRAILDLETKSGDTITKRSSIITKIFINRNGKWYMASLQGTSLP